ncbi:peptidase S8/S53 domain-containing protein [Truncatella angustata]|uniref:tripeptidyl-peptidase II n=1 Tax=Truncatella angustata TaxID=152316 RepID=A0A9P8RPW2_9PEZI|nr:peptidase S8/S53 domain-containing protein [Truncatella angustata]KAH6647170.1 peptidase S8/S53 domain-containing protein [Truncatella angustata]
MKPFITVLVLAASAVNALPSTNYVLHESRHASGIRKRSLASQYARADSNAIVPVKIGLAQSNLNTGYDRLMDVAHPSSPNYGKYLSQDEVIELFAPKKESVTAVKNWLTQSGISASRIKHYQNKGWLSVDMPVREAEALFQTQYHEVEHKGALKLGSEEYYLPQHIREHVDYVTPGVKLSSPMKKRSITRGNHQRSRPYKVTPSPADWQDAATIDAHHLGHDLAGCAKNFTPPCYRALYKIPEDNKALEGNSVGLYESGDTYSQEDIDLFFAKYAPYIPQGTSPIPAFVDGAVAPVPVDSDYNTGESEIDIDIVASLVYPQTITLYQVDDIPNLSSGIAGFLNTFLDALDGSYCTKTAYGITGDSAGIDASYPDTAPGGYNKTEMCGVYTPTKVISISYGEAELDLPKNYMYRQCDEFLKLALQGTTTLIASGDYGVASFAGDITESGCLSGYNLTETIYNPDAVSACPYVTSVGATQLQPNQTIHDPESAMQTALAPAPSPESRFSSSGGFSNYFPAPDYMKDALDTYFSKHDPGHPSYIANENATNIGEGGGLYNRAGRGFPDISANGANFRAFNGGNDYHWFGTSLAAPLWAAVLTLINQERQAIGKSPVGFINPVLYANPDSLTDIKNGSNANCGSSGFPAVEGWDPVTGLGTPNYPALLDLWLNLP